MAYSEKEKTRIINAICDKIANGKSVRLSLTEINISWSAFTRWIEKSEDKRKQYARAMSIRADTLFEELLDIADDGSNDWMTTNKGDIILDSEHVQRSKLRIDTRKWALSKMNPKKYGEKLDVTTDGEKVNTQPTIIFKKFNPDE